MVYCSRACLGRSKRNGSELFCAFCDQPFYRRFGEQDRGVRVNQFCSRSCYNEWRLINLNPETYPKIGTVHAHRVIAQHELGRPLTPHEVVHHNDMNKANSIADNLSVFPNQAVHMLCHGGKLSAEEMARYSLRRLAERERGEG